MNIFIVSYDLAQIGNRNYDGLIEKIKSYKDYTSIGESVYIIITDSKYTEVRDELKLLLDDQDKLFVGCISAPAAWYGLTSDTSKWLIKNL